MVTQYLKPDKSILVIGCGNSKFSEDLYEDGFKNITNIDFSENVINQMKEKYESKIPDMKWEHMDVKDMKFPDGEFDVIIDKACLDAICCGDNSVPNSLLMLKQV